MKASRYKERFAVEPGVKLEPDLVTIDEFARYFQVAPETVRGWIHQRRIKSIKIGRIHRFPLELVHQIREHGLPERPRTQIELEAADRRKQRQEAAIA